MTSWYNPIMTALAERRLSVEEYLELERASEVRHEFVNGTLTAMPGASKTHSQIVFNITLALGMAARANKCRLHQGDTQLLTPSGRYYYPDVMIFCKDNGDAYLEESPCCIFQVLSKSTEATDRGAKLEEYLKIESLQRYILIEQDSRLVTVYLRDPSGWRVEFLEGDAAFELPCLGTTLDLPQIYAGLD